MDTREKELRKTISRTARSLFDRGLTSGSSGNLSVRINDGWLMTPTGSTFGDLAPERISLLDGNGELLSGD
ncbi:MAG: class II aldolase/adducin family protein, partial [Desulfocapsaceae bacterium]|nr:class II aldolase/adducin family protein [Desulfocapsaceae bacterium]